MFALIVGGPIDPIAAGLALAIMFITICVFVTTWLSKRRSRLEVDHDFQLAKMKLSGEQSKGMITSHRENS